MTGPTLIVIVFIVLLLFGAPKLPGLAKSLGQSMKILKKEVGGSDADAKGDQGGEGVANSSDGSGDATPGGTAPGGTATGNPPRNDQGNSDRP
ncbi:twin-arginine translocase TatA/TatE family subunit [Leucobacter chromiisoli]